MKLQDPTDVEMFVSRYSPSDAAERTRKFIRNGALYLDPTDQIKWDGPGLWSPQRPRSEARKAHGWFWLRQFYSGYSRLTAGERVEVATETVKMLSLWLQESKRAQSMAFHDETTAQRVINLVVFFEAFEGHFSEEDATKVKQVILEDIQRLRSEKFYAGSNNHGMFQDIALLVAYNYLQLSPGDEKLALLRLDRYFQNCFTSEGIHTENNPSYHLMVASYVRKVEEYLLRTGQTTLADYESLLDQADLFAAYSLAPDLRFPPISDTNRAQLNLSRAKSVFGDGYFTAAVSRGEVGNLPASYKFVAPKSGYAICRSGWGADADMLMFTSAYNADYHKHSDEMSVYLYANGHELLCEAGPNGYQYDDPLTKYAFSTHAHNSMAVDGEGLPRIDGKAHLTSMKDVSTGDDCLEVIGSTRRYEGVSWSRKVSAASDLSDGIVQIEDTVISEQEHEYTFSWHLGVGVAAVVRGNFVELFDENNDEKLGELSFQTREVTAVSVFKGQRHPEVRGFAFPKMGTATPVYTIQVAVQHDGVSALRILWEMRTKDFLLKDRGISPSSLWQTFYGEKPVHYLLDGDAASARANGLAVVFSAVNPRYDFTFNYRTSLEKFSGAVMYVLDDFGDQGSYYLANNRNFAEFRSVQGAVREVLNHLGIAEDDVTMLGSSKGGSAAIMHGVALGAAEVIVGGPQYRIGFFTKDPHPNILEYIAGGTTTADSLWLDKSFQRLLESGSRKTKIRVFVGEADGHYRHHAVPLTDRARALGYSLDLIRMPGTTHAELGPMFSSVLRTFAESSDKAQAYVLPNAATYDNKTKTFGIGVALPAGAVGLAQLQVDGKNEGALRKLTGGHAQWEVLPGSGVARARVYVEIEPGASRLAFGTAPVRC